MSTVHIDPITVVCDECGCVSNANAGSIALRWHCGPKRFILPALWQVQLQRLQLADGETIAIRFLCPKHPELAQ